jgi:hypothetical protein
MEKELSNSEIKERIDQVYDSYVHSHERASNVDAARRRNYIPPEEMRRPFTI